MANKRIYRLSPLAEQDLEDIWLYTLREWSADQADRYYHSTWRREWPPTPVFLPGKSHGQRSPVGYSLWGHKESDTTERLAPSLHGRVDCTVGTGQRKEWVGWAPRMGQR